MLMHTDCGQRVGSRHIQRFWR